MKKNLETLAAHFRASEIKITQDIGHALYDGRRRTTQEPLTDKQLKAIKTVKAQCGMCVAAAAADHFGTRLYEHETRHVHYNLRDAIRKELDLQENPATVFVRDFNDGVRAIFKILKNGKDFQEWYEEQYGNEAYGPPDETDAAEYLHAKCDAPEGCFGSEDWPARITPAEVMQTAHDRNFG